MKSYQNQKGFTLIEAMVGIAIFSIGFLAVTSMQISALNSTTHSRKMTEASEIAARQIERLHALPFYPDYNDKSLSVSDRLTSHPDLNAGTTQFNEGIYTITIDIEDDNPLDKIDDIFTSSTDDITVSKTITVSAFETGNAGRVSLEFQMVKVWEHDG